MALELGAPLSREDLLSAERTLNLYHNKWDTRLGGSCMLSAQALVMGAREWSRLTRWAEQLAEENTALERELCRRPGLFARLGMPRPLRECLEPLDWSIASAAVRVMRFDFHPTHDGWAVSEVNSDVPGGYGEATYLRCLYQRFYAGTCLPPSPLHAWGDVMQAALHGGTALFLSAPGCLEDHQVVRVLMQHLAGRGIACRWIHSPSAIDWRRTDGVVRFYQAEWLAELPRRTGWRSVLSYGGPMTNPAIAILSESKRMPLLWPHLSVPCVTWRALLPECREPDLIGTADQSGWVLKGAYSNTGDAVIIGNSVAEREWGDALRRASRQPGRWVAQRRFEARPLDSVEGPVYPCIGVFVINGRAQGAYVRLSRSQLTDCLALEAPLFIKPESEANFD